MTAPAAGIAVVLGQAAVKRPPLVERRTELPANLRTDANADRGRDRTRVEDFVFARQVKRAGRAVRAIVVLAVGMIDLSAAPDQSEKLALKVPMVQQDDPPAVQQRLDLLVEFAFREL